MTTADWLDRILGQLDEVQRRCPELRFGQLLASIGALAEDETGHSLWDVEDADFAAALERFAGDMSRRGTAVGGMTTSPGAITPPLPRQVS